MKDYKKILKGVVNIINTTEKSDIGFGNICAYIGENCPELKESEDEKIRKAIHIYFDWLDGRKDYAPKGKYTIKDMIDWLEKQGEKIIPKNVDEAALQYVDTCPVDGEVTHDNIREPYWNNHSMMNAYKAGWLAKQGEQKQDPCEHCADKRLNCHNFPCVKGRAFKQGKSALEVIKEEKVDKDIKVEQNPSWSEEDENLLKLSVENLTEIKDRFGKDYGRVGDCINWLKSLKGRVQPQQKRKWSEWDRSKIQRICKYLDEAKKYYADITEVRECIDWLKFLRPQYTWQPSDEQMDALQYIYRNTNPQFFDKLGWDSIKTLESLYQDLKKLK